MAEVILRLLSEATSPIHLKPSTFSLFQRMLDLRLKCLTALLLAIATFTTQDQASALKIDSWYLMELKPLCNKITGQTDQGTLCCARNKRISALLNAWKKLNYNVKHRVPQALQNIKWNHALTRREVLVLLQVLCITSYRVKGTFLLWAVQKWYS